MRRPRLHLRFWISPVALKYSIVIVAIIALFGTSVQAADLPVAPSSAPIPVSTPNWTGPYIGLNFGLRYDAVDAMLLKEFLKKHRQGQKQERKLEKLEATIAQIETFLSQQGAEVRTITDELAATESARPGR